MFALVHDHDVERLLKSDVRAVAPKVSYRHAQQLSLSADLRITT